MTESEIVAILRQHIKCDATGLSPSVASVYLVGFEEAAQALLERLEVRDTALRLIASCASHAPGDVVDIARSALRGDPRHD
ncbi:hypothetical protein [Ancylobacter polymorphus]|uniref:Uncharacterized protein n=1 Tax=Ancylobacter polymorphus TaxID=223390 RepID=A0ABU0BDW4_9HYPH|nr:hypothetical protein [Ancylobacter polymorphus]MDQ0303784.1 hypothetical protein [Ancylobacter polymorphus]